MDPHARKGAVRALSDVARQGRRVGVLTIAALVALSLGAGADAALRGSASTHAVSLGTAHAAAAARPVTPRGLKVVSVGPGKVKLDWADNTAARMRYQVYRDGKRIADRLKRSRYTVTGLTNGRRHSFRVSAGRVQPYSRWTKAVTATPTAKPAAGRPADPGPAPAALPAPKPKAAPAGQVLWSADFESSAFDPFKDYFENVDAPEPRLVTGPVAQGARAGRFEAPADSPRNEVVMDGELTNGTTRYFGWAMHLPPNLSTESDWRVLAQWRHNGRNGSPPVSLKLQNGRYLIDGGEIDTDRSSNDVGEESQPMQYDLGSADADEGIYVRWVFGIKFAVGELEGWVSVWKNGVQLADQVPWRTMYRQEDGDPFTSSLKFGIYRHDDIDHLDVVHHDDWKMGTTYDSVAG